MNPHAYMHFVYSQGNAERDGTSVEVCVKDIMAEFSPGKYELPRETFPIAYERARRREIKGGSSNLSTSEERERFNIGTRLVTRT